MLLRITRMGLWISLSVLFLLFSHCSKQKNKFVLPSKEFLPYVSGFTGGVISTTGIVKIKLVNAFSEQVRNEVGDKVFEFSPAIKGQTQWLDDYTVQFVPEQRLPQKQFYQAKFNIGKLQPMPKNLEVFPFQFATMAQSAMIKLGHPFVADAAEPTIISLEGEVRCLDAADDKEVEAAMDLEKLPKGTRVEWTHLNNGRLHKFRVSGLVRTSAKQLIPIMWRATSIGASRDLQEVIEILPEGQFECVGVDYIQEGDESMLMAYFSDVLSPEQELRGLLHVPFGRANFTKEGSRIKIFAGGGSITDGELTLEPEIKNLAGKALGQRKKMQYFGEFIKPSVQMVSKGHILPNADGLKIYFKAAQLKAVDVKIIRIFESNILDYMSESDIGTRLFGSYQHGKVVFKQKVDLNVSDISLYNEGTFHALELNQLIRTEPGALYEVRIGFRKSYTTFPCADGYEVPLTRPDGEEWIANDGELVYLPAAYQHSYSSSNEETEEADDGEGYYQNEDVDYYYEDYYNSDYYRNRSNPCKKEFYYYTSNATIAVLASDIGLITEKVADRQWYFTTSNLLSAQPESGVQLELYNLQRQLIAKLNTDHKGFAFWQNDLEDEQPRFLVARKGSMRNYLKLNDYYSRNIANYDVSGAVYQQGLKGNIYGERGVWRPGDSLYLNFILEDAAQPLPVSHPIIFELFNSRGQVVYKTVQAKVPGQTMYPFFCATSPDAPTGNYRATVSVGNAVFSKSLRVETIMPNRMKIQLDIPEKGYAATDKNLQAKLAAHWLHGAPARMLRADVTVNTSKEPTKFSQWSDYTFDHTRLRYEQESITLFDGLLDQEGKATFNPLIPGNIYQPGTLKLGFNIRVFEPGGAFSVDRFNTFYKTHDAYVGLRMGQKANSDGALPTGKPIKLEFVSCDPSGQSLPNRKLSLSIVKLNWDWWWQWGANEEFDYINTEYMQVFKTLELNTDAAGRASTELSFDESEWGSYKCIVMDEGSKHGSSIDFYVDSYAGSRRKEQKGTSPTSLILSCDKKEYFTGDKVEVNIPSTENSKILIQLETANQILQRQWIDGIAGETKFGFKATAEMAPNIYLRAVVLKPHAETANDMPIRTTGLIYIPVEAPKTRLLPVIQSPESVRPNSMLQVQVSESNKQAMEYTLALVDDGLLDLTRFKTPKVWNDFYARQALNHLYFDVYDQVIGAFGGSLESVVTIGGGDDADEQKQEAKANRFKPMVRFLGPFRLKAGQTASHQISIPAYYGSCRIMVLAANDQKSYGSAEKDVKVQSPLMLLATLPRVLTPGEKVLMPVNVFATAALPKAEIQAKVRGAATLVGSATQNIQFKKFPDDGMLYFELQVKEQTGKVTVDISGKAGAETASQSIEIEVRAPNLPITETQFLSLAETQTKIRLPAIGMQGSQSARLEFSILPPFDLSSSLRFLTQYPHGCIEQTTSAAFPQLHLASLVSLDDGWRNTIQRNVKAAIQRISLFQTASGGLAYWPGNGGADEWGTNYAGHFLIEARNAGYQINQSLIDRWKQFQTARAKEWGSETKPGKTAFGTDDYTQAYRLFTLALAKAPELGAMNKLRERGQLSEQARWRLAAAYALCGQKEAARKLIQGLNTQPASLGDYSYNYGSSLYDASMVLEALVYLGDQQQAAVLMQNIAATINKSSSYATQTTAYVLLAMQRYVQAFATAQEINLQVKVNGEVFPLKTTKPMAWLELKENANGWNIEVQKTGKGNVSLRAMSTGILPAQASEAVNNGLALSVQYLNQEGKPVSVDKLSQGTDIYVWAEVHNRQQITHRNVALSAMFPGAWEISNSRMEANANTRGISPFEYQDTRDDRVLTYFHLKANERKKFMFRVNAAYAGRFYLPAIVCEAMYEPAVMARSASAWVEVIRPVSALP